ncbi:MAG TPA: acetylornithine deacetylase [Pyrinomonadaceae bacterium]|nr:acetylornithine deacetylase [Pyrinomonadaceae bacterium]
MKVEDTLAELVAINSISANSNLEIVKLLSARLERLGMCGRMYPYTDDKGVKKFNLVMVHPKTVEDGGHIELALVGHTDTVPFDPNWLEATTLIERDGKLYGRGACDAKGFIAAALTAVSSIDLKSLGRPLALIFTADEEIGLIGAKRLAQAKPLTTRYSIVGEPTSLRPMRAGKGYCLAEVVVRGREAHSAYPALGASAISRAARVITRIDKISEELRGEQHQSFDPPFTTANVGLIHGGTAKNVIPGECRFTLEWRPVPGQDAYRFLDMLNAEIAEARGMDPDFECVVDADRADGGFETSPESPLVKMLEEYTGQAAGTVAFGTEAVQMIELGAEAVVMGPGDIRVAHRTGEYVPKADLNRCVEVLQKAITTLCA